MKCQLQRRIFSEALICCPRIKLSVNQVETGQRECTNFVIVNLLIIELYSIIIEIQKRVKCT